MDQQVAATEIAIQEQPNKTTNYLNFDLKIHPGNGREYPIGAINSSGERVQATMHFPFDEVELKDYLYDLRLAVLNPTKKPDRVLSQKEQRVQDFGKRLFDVLITGEIRDLYDAHLQHISTQPGIHLTLRLSIEPYELASLPWEFLYDSRKGSYVCLIDNVSIIHYTDIPNPPASLKLNPPLRILGMLANPSDQDPINRDHEKSLVEEALKDLKKKGMVKITWFDEIIQPEKQTWDELQKDLSEGPWHAFHFIGYGRFEPSIDDGQIALQTNKGQTHWLDAKKMASTFAAHQSLQLIVLNASEGARGTERDIFSTTAATLTTHDIPAVLSLPYKITDQAKRKFICAFYTGLANGISIDVVVAEARKAINSGAFSSLEFGTSVLSTCSTDYVLFDVLRKQRHKRLNFPRVHWRSVIQTLAAIFIFVAIILLFLSIIYNWGTLVGLLSAVFAVLGAIGIGKVIPQGLNIILNILRQVPFRLKRFFWPSPLYSRRWFLKGLIFGVGTGLTLGGLATITIQNISLRKRSSSDNTTGEPVNVYTGHHNTSTGGTVNAVGWSPDGEFIASAGADETVQVWKWNSSSADNNPYTGHNGAVNGVTWSPDGKLIASASNDLTVQIWEASSKNSLFTYKGHSQPVMAVVWAPNGNYIASASTDGTVQVFDAITGKLVRKYSKHNGPVNAVAWSPDSKYIVSGGYDKTAQVWEAITGNLLISYTKHEAEVTSVAWSAVLNDKPIISASSGQRPVHLWNPFDKGKYLYLNYGSDTVNSVTWSPTGKRIALTDGSSYLEIWDPFNNMYLYGLQSNFSGLHAVSWAPKGQHIAAADQYNQVYVWITKD